VAYGILIVVGTTGNVLVLLAVATEKSEEKKNTF
jgi:hypothetical protein